MAIPKGVPHCQKSVFVKSFGRKILIFPSHNLIFLQKSRLFFRAMSIQNQRIFLRKKQTYNYVLES